MSTSSAQSRASRAGRRPCRCRWPRSASPAAPQTARAVGRPGPGRFAPMRRPLVMSRWSLPHFTGPRALFVDRATFWLSAPLASTLRKEKLRVAACLPENSSRKCLGLRTSPTFPNKSAPTKHPGSEQPPRGYHVYTQHETRPRVQHHGTLVHAIELNEEASNMLGQP